MATLPPTVHERIARCGTKVLVTGIVNGADVQLDVDGVIQSFTATGGQRNVTVPPLVEGSGVRARQDEGFGFSPWSPEIIVEDVELPPPSPPLLPVQVGACSHCVRVDGAVPGSRIELRVGGDVVGGGTANRHGGGCFKVDLVRFGGDPPGQLVAVMVVCGAESPPATSPLVVETPLGQPTVIGPLFGCQRIVPLNDVHRGAKVRIESSAGSLGSFCSCWNNVNVNIGSQLVAGDSVRAQAFWEGRGSCIGDGPWSAWEPVVPPDERIAPEIQAPLIEGDQMLRVTGQIPGATLLISIDPLGDPPQEWGPVPSSVEPEIALADPLKVGSVVTVTQTLCAVSATSEPVVVQAAPAEVFAPTIIPPLHACGAAVQVSNLHPGAVVRLFSNGFPIGIGFAGMNTSISISCSALVMGSQITANQVVGGVTSPDSDAESVIKFSEPHNPRFVGPVALGDQHVWVSGLTPGCRVTVTSGGEIVGEVYVAESLSRIPLFRPVETTLAVGVDICGETAKVDRIEPVDSPCRLGPLKSGEKDLSFDDWTVPATADGVEFTTKMRGVVYFPAKKKKNKLDPDQTNLPVIIIAHGFWDETWVNPDTGNIEPIESFRGYDYLCHHLASWGMLVFSIDMDDVNLSTLQNSSGSAGTTHAFSRGEIVLHAIDELLAHPVYGVAADKSRIGILGHSMAGEGVIAAQQLNRDESRGYEIRGVVSLAPTRWHDDIVVSDTDYLQLFGSMDQLNYSATGNSAKFAGVRSYDDAFRPKTHGWIHGLRHNPFNRRWLATTDFLESSYADSALPAATHELVARCLINAFFQRSVVGRADYAAYMEATVLPSSLDHVAVHLQHSRDPRDVIDNYGDADPQAGIAASAIDGASNSLGLSVENLPAGSLVPFEDIALIDLADSSHDTNGVHFGWAEPGTRYRTSTINSIPTPRGAVALRVAQFYDDGVANPPGVAADAFVRLEDGSGNEAFVRLGAASTIPYPDHDLSNDDGPDPLALMRTVSLPADAFTAALPALDMNNLISVTLVMSARATGHLFADDIEIWR